MISWRYHLVSIVAVILAVALGVLAGATVVGDRFVSTLRRQTVNAQREADKYRVEADLLQRFMGEAVRYLTTDRLAGDRVVLVTQEPVDDGVRAQVVGALRGAGATVVAQLTATAQIVNPAAQADLGALLARPPADPAQLPAALAAQLANRVEFGPAARSGTTDFLAQSSPFVRIEPRGVDLHTVGGPGTLVVVFAGGTNPPALNPGSFLLPFIEQLVKAPHEAPLAVGEGTSSDWGFVKAVRDANGQIPQGWRVTVDDLDRPYGGAALVLGLADLVASPGGGGDYGLSGASFLPTPVPSGS